MKIIPYNAFHVYYHKKRYHYVSCNCTGDRGANFADGYCFGCGGTGVHLCYACNEIGE